jgi:hypothetical protein
MTTTLPTPQLMMLVYLKKEVKPMMMTLMMAN